MAPFPLRLPHKIPLCPPPIRHKSYMSLPIPFSLILSNDVKSILEYNYFPQYPIIESPHATIPSECDRIIFTFKLLINHERDVVYFSCTNTTVYVATVDTKVNKTDKSIPTTSQAVNTTLLLDTCCSNSFSCLLLSCLKASAVSSC